MCIFIVILSFLIFFLASISVFINESLHLTRQMLDNEFFLVYNTEKDDIRGDEFERKRTAKKNY